MLPEFGKLVYYTYSGEIPLPHEYYILAPMDIGAKLNDLIDTPSSINIMLIEKWDSNCRTKITKEPIDLSPELKSYIESFDFNIIKTKSMLEVIEEHKSTAFYAFRFGGGLTVTRDRHITVPDVIEKYETIKQHYAEELKRNGMVSTYTDFLEQLPHLDCPVCHQPIATGVIDSDSSEALFEYFKVHAVQLKSKIQDLTYSINDIKERLESNKESIRRLLEENKQLSETIAEKQASLSKLNRNIATIRQLDAMKKSLEIYQQDLSSVELDIIAYSEKVKKTKQSTNKSTSTLYNDYCSEIESVLKKWGFPENVDVTFDAETLDLSIDGKARSDWGKGYRAFILSAMVIGLMRYCFKNNRLHPGFVILDSPLVSLKERKKDESGEWIDDYMEKKMVEDILEEDCLHQVIIFENKDIQYGHQYNYIQFNHEGNVRKGFIPSQEEYC